LKIYSAVYKQIGSGAQK